MNPLVSIIIPVYNAEKDIQRCLDSIIAQTIVDWECLLVNDGSPDNSASICVEYMRKDSRFKLYNKENGGPSSARNYGLEQASGDFVCFVDSDDYVKPLFLEHLVSPMLADNAINITVVGLERFGNEKGMFPSEPFTKTLLSEEVFEHLLRGDIIKGWLCNKCLRRSIIGNIRLKESLRYCEDLEFLLRLTYYNPEFKVCFVEGYDYCYCIQNTGNSLSHSVKNKIPMIDKFNEYIEEYPDSESKRIRLLKGCYTQCRSLAMLDSIGTEEKKIIKKARASFLLYKREVLSSFNRAKILQIILIYMSFRLYRIIMKR